MTRILLASLLGLAACTTARIPAPPSAPVAPKGVTLTADQSAYARGASAKVTLRNGAPGVAQTGVLECAHIEAWDGTAWEESAVGNDRACILVLRILQPGETMTGMVPLDVPDGTYRLTQPVSFDGTDESVTAATAPFQVTG